jgi:hypothetical protein
MSTINTEAPALAIEWPWGQALKLGGALWTNVMHELTGQDALLCYLGLHCYTAKEMHETIEFLRAVAQEHLYG